MSWKPSEKAVLKEGGADHLTWSQVGQQGSENSCSCRAKQAGKLEAGSM